MQFNGTLDSDGTPRSLSVLAGTGTIAFAGAVGGTSALDSLLLRSNHAGAGAITQGAGAPLAGGREAPWERDSWPRSTSS